MIKGMIALILLLGVVVGWFVLGFMLAKKTYTAIADKAFECESRSGKYDLVIDKCYGAKPLR